MWLADNWTDYELLDCSCGEKLERWGRYTLVRPDPQVIWKTPKEHPGWRRPDARYERSQSGGGRWHRGIVPDRWQIGYGELCGSLGGNAGEKHIAGSGEKHIAGSGEKHIAGPLDKARLCFNVSLMNFKHTGLFPEQAVNWEFIAGMVRSAGRVGVGSASAVSVLNLFAYTGGATLAAASAGATVCHVDAARGMVSRAKENAASSGLGDKPIRWIVDDCFKFVEREARRGRKYDAIIMDPPAFGRGPSGEVWKLEDGLYDFVKLCAGVLSDDPLFVLVNSYTTGLSPSTLTYITQSLLGGHAESGEIGLPVSEGRGALPCGATCRWTPG